MRAIAFLGVLAALTTFGCASTGTTAAQAERDFSGDTRRANPSLRVGPAHVVNAGNAPTRPTRSAQASRVQLDGGRFVVCWTRGSLAVAVDGAIGL